MGYDAARSDRGRRLLAADTYPTLPYPTLPYPTLPYPNYSPRTTASGRVHRTRSCDGVRSNRMHPKCQAARRGARSRMRSRVCSRMRTCMRTRVRTRVRGWGRLDYDLSNSGASLAWAAMAVLVGRVPKRTDCRAPRSTRCAGSGRTDSALEVGQVGRSAPVGVGDRPKHAEDAEAAGPSRESGAAHALWHRSRSRAVGRCSAA